MKAIWKGKLTFGLVAIDIQLLAATQTHTLGFKLLHEKCLTPITYKRWCPHCNQEVEWSQVVKGLPLPDGTYFVLTKENIQKLKPEKSTTLAIVEVVDQKAIAPIYYDHHYYLVSGAEENKAYYIFTQALADLQKVAIGQFVLREKQYVCAIQPYKHGLLLSTLNYAYEIRTAKEIEEMPAKIHIDQKELKLADLLIKQLYTKKFELEKFKDTFFVQLKKEIEAMLKGTPLKKKEKPSRVVKPSSLEEALRASLKSGSEDHGVQATEQRRRSR